MINPKKIITGISIVFLAILWETVLPRAAEAVGLGRAAFSNACDANGNGTYDDGEYENLPLSEVLFKDISIREAVRFINSLNPQLVSTFFTDDGVIPEALDILSNWPPEVDPSTANCPQVCPPEPATYQDDNGDSLIIKSVADLNNNGRVDQVVYFHRSFIEICEDIILRVFTDATLTELY